jgi:hypothetical protein
LAITFETEAPESPGSAGSPNFAQYFNTGPVKVLRSLDFSVGSSGAFTIHLVDPVPAREEEVRISENLKRGGWLIPILGEEALGDDLRGHRPW